MTYSETLDWLFTQTAVFEHSGVSAYKPGLDTIRALCARLGNPHERYPTIHVAGTNGKGSTASTLAAILQSAGYRVGLYTSPHLVDFRERIRVNGDMIPNDEVCKFVEEYRHAPLGASFFELTTAMAFDWFARCNVDIAVIEVGLGGRLDSTNIITPLVSIITNISPDHTALLGNSPAEIAAEKAGIIKPGVPVVIGEASDANVRHVFEFRAEEMNAQIIFAPEIEARELTDGTWEYTSRKIHGSLRGEFQPRNAATVLTALQFCPPVSEEAVCNGFENVENITGLRGRLTVYQNEPFTIIYDTGHNPGAWQYLSRELQRMERPLTVVCGFAADKDVKQILTMMPKDARYIFTCPSTPRGLPADELAATAAEAGLNGEVIPTVAAAVMAAMTPPPATLFIGGSNFVVADFLASRS